MLTSEEVQKIALLSRIGLREEELPKYQKDLSAVLDFFRELETLPTESIAPIGHITGRTNVLRHDDTEVFETEEEGALMKNVPAAKDNFLKVRSVF